MGRHGFGRGEYKHFSHSLPPLIQSLRTAAYGYLVAIANQWHERMGNNVRFPEDHAAFLERCHQAGQVRRPDACLINSYVADAWLSLHHDRNERDLISQ